MKPYVKQQDRDAPHPNGKPTPKYARKRADKKAVRQTHKIECDETEEKDECEMDAITTRIREDFVQEHTVKAGEHIWRPTTEGVIYTFRGSSVLLTQDEAIRAAVPIIRLLEYWGVENDC